MNRSIKPLLGALGVLLASTMSVRAASAAKTKLCHVPSNGAPFTTITVRTDAAKRLHLSHGDVVGVCNDLAVCVAVCDDHNACTVNDGLVYRGTCTCGPRAVTCAQDANPCTVEMCNPSSGLCGSISANEGRACYEASACTQHDGTCQSGVCLGSTAVDCPAIDVCHEPGVCDPATGACVNRPKLDGAPCNDGNVCTAGDVCVAGTCASGIAYACDDGDECTADACDGAGGCAHTQIDRCGICFANDCATCQTGCTCAQICWTGLMGCLNSCTTQTYCAAYCVADFGHCGGAMCPALEATCRSGCEAQNGCTTGCTQP